MTSTDHPVLWPIGVVESVLTDTATAPKQGAEGAPDAWLAFEPDLVDGLRDLKVGPPADSPMSSHESEFVVGQVGPTTKPGTYSLFVSVGARDGTPRIAMPLQGEDGQRRYRLGDITLTER